MSAGADDISLEPRPPIVVDMDGTILCSDTLVEGIAAGLFQKPFSTIANCVIAAASVPRFKAWVFRNAEVDYDAIPANDRLIAWLEDQKSQGRSIHLVSAANQGVVDRIARRFAIFDSAHGSTETHNLKGTKKRDFIQERFGADAVYVGDSRPDLAVWQGLRGAVYAGCDPGIAKRLKADGRLEAEFSRPAASLGTWLRALRLHQWSKNLLLFAPLILAHAYTDTQAVISTVLAFLILGVAASGAYLVNDLSDLSADRRHRSKKNRPIPAAHLPVAHVLVAAPVLIGGGLAAAWFLKPGFALALAAYLAVTLAYSLRLKRIPLLDVFVLATLYTLRLVMGAFAANVAHSLWLLTFSMFFFFSLSLAKRHVEVAAARGAPGEQIKGRGYFPEDWPLTLGLGIAAGSAAILILVLYIVDAAYGADVYRSPAYLGGIPVVIAFWTARIWLLAHRGQLHDDPVAFAMKDNLSLGLGCILAGLLAAALLL